METNNDWADDLVGRWWEIFWDPDPSNEEGELEKEGGMGNEMEEETIESKNRGEAVASSSVVDLTRDDDDDALPSPRAPQPEYPVAPAAASAPAHRRQQLASMGGSSSPMLAYQHHPPSLQEQISQPTPAVSTRRLRQRMDVVFNTPTLGLGLVLVDDTRITITEVKSPERNNIGDILRPNDILVGVDGKKFDEIIGNKIEGAEAFKAVVLYLKARSRPMTVMFERWVAVGAEDIGGDDVDPIPPNQLGQHTPQKRTNDGDGDDTRDIAAGAADNENDDDAYADNEDDDGGTEEDDIDWYDAKVLSYDAKNNKFKVYFLGSEKTVSYEMSLSTKGVRPSVRAWTRRTLALLCLDEKAASILDGSKCDGIEHCLPPSTERREDTHQLEIISQRERDSRSGGANYAVRQMMEYKILLAKQQYLATHLSPHVDEGDDDVDEDEVGCDDHPGPLADSNYIKYLCNCMKEAENACEWLIGESAILDVLSKLAVTANARATRENILSFLVNGARFLRRMISLNPANKSSGTSHSTPATPIGRGKGGRKKRRVESAIGAVGGVINDEVFDTMLSKALLSNESLRTMLNQLLNSSHMPNRVWLASILTESLSRLFHDLWEPVTSWIRKSEDIISGASGQFYSLEDIDSHLQLSETKGSKLASVDLSEWNVDLHAKLHRAKLFEMEVWSAIRACTQPVVTVLNTTRPTMRDDDCLVALVRLNDEATHGDHSPRVANDPVMRNLNPLGRRTIDYSTGLTLPSSLNRGVINDAIAVRRWVLDFNRAKTVRERAGFVQNVIERYGTLPQLPQLPTLSEGFDGLAANPSTILAANTKDSITLLSSNCYSYTHIIGNIAATLQRSMSGNDFLDANLRTKEGVMLALSELTRLPILSIVEEKLRLREELIDWDAEAQQIMDLSAHSKLPLGKIEALHHKLSLILTLKSDRRGNFCKQLYHDQSVEETVKAFAVADEKVICSVTGVWVRDQYTKASEWQSNFCSIFTILKNAKSQGECVAIDRITTMLTHHDSLDVSFVEEYNQLERVRQKVTEWANTINQILYSGSLSLEERCQRLSSASSHRPSGVLVDPAEDLIHLWIWVFNWRLQLQSGVRTMVDQISNMPQSQIQCPEALKVIVRSSIAPLMIEDFIFPDEFVSNPFLTQLRHETFRSIQTQTATRSTMRKDIELGIYGKHVLDLILDAEADKLLGSCLSISRRIFWMMIVQCFFVRLESDSFIGALSDAKELLSLSHKFIHTSFMDTKIEENRLKSLIENAENLESKSLGILDQCTALLESDCYSHKADLRLILVGLSDVKSSFNNAHLAPAIKLLQDKTLKVKVCGKIEELTWLLGTFSYDLFYKNADLKTSNLLRIHINNLRDLHATIPCSQRMDSANIIRGETVRISLIVKDLWDRANAWQSKILSLQDSNNESDEVVIDTLIALSEDNILSKVIMPEIEMVTNITAVARQVQTRLQKELFSGEYMGATDVSQARLPNRRSLIEYNGNFVLHRFTGSEMYGAIRQALFSIMETAAQLPVRTSEKATLEWMVSIFNWVESIHSVEDSRHQLVIKIEHGLEILEKGHDIFYSVSDEVLSYLRGVKAGLQVLPQCFEVVLMSDGTYTLGIGLLRWAALLFECLKSDVDKEDRWKERVLELTNRFHKFDSESMGGALASFRDATSFRDTVDSLMCESSNLIIQDDEVMHSLYLLSKKMKANPLFQKSLDLERALVEEKRLLFEERKFMNPHNVVMDRYDLLDSLMSRFASIPYESDVILLQQVDDESLIAGEASVRDKSRFFLEKSLWTGMETLGFDPKETDAQDFCSIIAWRLEEAVFEKYHPHDVSDLVSSEYRDKVRSLRFNLQDPKNPMLCARVLAGNMPLDELVSASTEALASNELKLKRRKVEEEAIKNVVLAADTEKKDQIITNDLAAKIRIESTKMKRSYTPEAVTSDSMSEEYPFHENAEGVLSKSSLEGDFYHSLLLPSPTSRLETKETNQIVASLPPPPMRMKRMPNEFVGSALESTYDQFDDPPTQSPRLTTMQNRSHDSKSPARHILSKSGTDLFQISISKLKISFTTKIAAEVSCDLDVDRRFPSILVEKGRLSVDELNKFIHSKTKGGRWNLAYLKLSSITGESNIKSYKTFYKEYESLGRLAMIQVSDSTKIFLIPPKFTRQCKCLNNIDNLSKSSTYAVVLTNEVPYLNQHTTTISDDLHIDDDMF